jgi:hypothetical protein
LFVGSGFTQGKNVLENISPINGTTSRLANLSSTIQRGLDYRSNNGLLYAGGLPLKTIDPTTYSVNSISGPNQSIASLSFSPLDHLYTVDFSNHLSRLDPATGNTLSSVSITAVSDGDAIINIDFAPDGTLYGVGVRALYTVEPSTGVATRITPSNRVLFNLFTTVNDIDFGPDGILRCTGWTPEFLPFVGAINLDTGLGSRIGSVGSTGYLSTTLDGIATVPVPEPTALQLVSVCSLCLVFLGKRQLTRNGAGS